MVHPRLDFGRGAVEESFGGKLKYESHSSPRKTKIRPGEKLRGSTFRARMSEKIVPCG